MVSFALFDSSALPDTDTVSAATVSCYGNSSADNFNQGVVLTNSTPDSNTAIGNADYTDHNTQMNTELGTARIDITSWSNTAYNDFTVLSPDTNISKTSLSKFGFRISGEFDNVEPTWAASVAAEIRCIAADTAGTATDPTLIVTHEAGAVEGGEQAWFNDIF